MHPYIKSVSFTPEPADWIVLTLTNAEPTLELVGASRGEALAVYNQLSAADHQVGMCRTGGVDDLVRDMLAPSPIVDDREWLAEGE